MENTKKSGPMNREERDAFLDAADVVISMVRHDDIWYTLVRSRDDVTFGDAVAAYKYFADFVLSGVAEQFRQDPEMCARIARRMESTLKQSLREALVGVSNE